LKVVGLPVTLESLELRHLGRYQQHEHELRCREEAKNEFDFEYGEDSRHIDTAGGDVVACRGVTEDLRAELFPTAKSR